MTSCIKKPARFWKPDRFENEGLLKLLNQHKLLGLRKFSRFDAIEIHTTGK